MKKSHKLVKKVKNITNEKNNELVKKNDKNSQTSEKCNNLKRKSQTSKKVANF